MNFHHPRPNVRRPLTLALAALAALGCGYVEPEALTAVAPAAAEHAVAVDEVTAIASPRPGSVAGALRGPAPGLIASEAAGVIGGNTAGVIGGNTAGVIGGNTAGVIGGNTGNYVLLEANALSVPVAGAAIALYDSAGRLLADGATTDQAGRFRFEGVSSAERVLFIRAHYRQEGHDVELAAAAPVPMAGEALAVAVDPATTLVAKRTSAMLAARMINVAALEPAALERLASELAAVLEGRDVVAAAILPPERIAGELERLALAHEALALELRRGVDEPGADAGPGAPAGPAAPGEVASSALPAASGRVETLAGGGGPGFADGRGEQARFAFPQGLALDDAGNLYVADYNNHRIRRVTPAGEVATITGDGTPGCADGPASVARLRNPHGLAWHAGVLYVVDAGNQAVRRLSQAADGGWRLETLAGGPAAAGPPAFVAPRDLAVDPTSTPPSLYVADTGGSRVRKLALGEPGRPVTTAFELAAGGAQGQLAGPQALAVGGDGALYVGDATANAIRRFPQVGAPGTFAGSGFVGLLDGQGLAARFAYPASLAFGPQGELYVADQLNHAVRRVAASGEVTTVAGAGVAGAADGVGTAARFFRPSAVAVGPDGLVFVADTDNHRICRIRP